MRPRTINYDHPYSPGDRVSFLKVWSGDDEIVLDCTDDRGIVHADKHGWWVIWDTGEADIFYPNRGGVLNKTTFSIDFDDAGRQSQKLAVPFDLISHLRGDS